VAALNMKNKIERELGHKEFENEIELDLHKQELDKEKQKKLDEEYHPAVLLVLNFFGNLVVGYIIFFLTISFLIQVFQFFLDSINKVYFLVFHLIIWIFAIIGAFTKKSPWEKLLR
tara:strand:+ start:48973 stop:49320 length:348 start_codon:yes stop_codon:yes gene_type:complete